MYHSFDKIPVAISVRSTEGRYKYVNRAWCELFSLDRKDALDHTDAELELQPLALPEKAQEWDENGLAYRDVYLTTPQKGRLLLELVESPVNGSENEILCVHQDMTGIGWRLEDMSRNLSQMDDRHRRRSQCIARFSAELAEPLRHMQRYCEMLHGSALSDDQRGWADLVLTNTSLLLRQLEGSLALSLSENAESLTSEEKEIRVDRIVESLGGLYSRAASDCGVAVATHVDDSLRSPVYGDAGYIRQLIVHMVDSVLRSAHGGALNVDVVGLTRIGNQRPIRIRVSGHGAPCNLSANQPRVRSGLSVQIVRGLCGLLGGRLEVEHNAHSAVLTVYMTMRQKSFITCSEKEPIN